MWERFSKYKKEILVIAGTAGIAVVLSQGSAPESTTFKGGDLPYPIPTPKVLEYDFDFIRGTKGSLLFSPYLELPSCPEGSTEWEIEYRKFTRSLGFYDLSESIPYKSLDGDTNKARTRLFISAKNPEGFYSGDAVFKCKKNGQTLSSENIRYGILFHH